MKIVKILHHEAVRSARDRKLRELKEGAVLRFPTGEAVWAAAQRLAHQRHIFANTEVEDDPTPVGMLHQKWLSRGWTSGDDSSEVEFLARNMKGADDTIREMKELKSLTETETLTESMAEPRIGGRHRVEL
jgi:hypothetical protein